MGTEAGWSGWAVGDLKAQPGVACPLLTHPETWEQALLRVRITCVPNVDL